MRIHRKHGRTFRTDGNVLRRLLEQMRHHRPVHILEQPHLCRFSADRTDDHVGIAEFIDLQVFDGFDRHSNLPAVTLRDVLSLFIIHCFLGFCQEVTTLKRLFLLCLCCLLLAGCTVKEENGSGYLIYPAPETTTRAPEAQSDPIRAVWLSYLEWNPQKLLTESAYRAYIKQLLAVPARIGATDLFLQVRAFADAIYPSAYFDSSAWVVRERGDALPFDYLSVILEEASAVRLRVHAWINPYRVLSDTKQIQTICASSAVGQLLQDKERECFLETESGLYLQPAAAEAQAQILDGVRELLDLYPLAGIHLDDYFYPPDVNDEDDDLFEQYRVSGGKKNKQDWRCAQVNALLQSLYKIVHADGAERVLSISPGGDMEKDKALHCADVRLWCKKRGYCDWIVPQLYYGFLNEALPFRRTAKAWRRICKSSSVRLIGGLAVYKIGKADQWAGESGKTEWMENPSLIAKQAKVLRRYGYDGCSLYSAQFVNFQEKVCANAFRLFDPVL